MNASLDRIFISPIMSGTKPLLVNASSPSQTEQVNVLIPRKNSRTKTRVIPKEEILGCVSDDSQLHRKDCAA